MAFRCINAFTIESLMRRSLLKCSITKYEVIINLLFNIEIKIN